jgi:hypothetical protein
MSYVYQLDIGSLTNPVIGDGYVTVVPVIKDAMLIKSVDSKTLIARTLLDGRIKFTGGTAAALNTLALTAHTCPIQIMWDSTVIFVGRLNLREEADMVSLETYHTVEAVDGYETLMRGADKDINWLRNQAMYTVDVDYVERDVLRFSPTSWRNNDVVILQTTQDNQFTYYARVEKTVPNAIASLLVGTGGWYLVSISGGNSLIARSWQDAGYDKETFDKFLFVCRSNISGQWVLNDIATFTSSNCANVFVGSFTGKIAGFDADSNGYYYYMMRDQIFAQATFRHTRVRRLDETITNIMQQIDPTLMVDSQTYTDFDSWCDLLVSAVSDMKLVLEQSPTNIYSFFKTETSNRATKEEMSWNRLWSILGAHPFNFRWYLEDISGTYYLRVRHISSFNKSVGSFSLITYKGVNWSQNKTRYRYDAELISRYIRKITAERIDFQGVDVLLPDVPNGQELNVDLSGIYTDLLHLYHNPGEYPDTGMVLIAAQTGTAADYDCINDLGVISNDIETNEPLTLSRMDYETRSAGDRPARYHFNQATINGAVETVDEGKRRLTNEIYVPVRMPDEVDFNKIISADIGHIEPERLVIPLNELSGGAKITGRF